MKKKYIVPVIAILTFTIGSICLFLPFLPFGWFLYAVTALLILPYFPPMERLFRWLMKKDNSGWARKAGDRVAALYRWAGDNERASELERFYDEAENHSDPDRK